MAWPNQIFDQLRLANIFGPPQQNQQDQPYDPEADFAKLYQPQMQMQNQFQDLLNNYPQEQPPSIWRKIGASIAGMGSKTPFETAYQAAHAPYLQALQNWQQQAGVLDKAADNERQGNTQQRLYANQVVSQREADKKNQETERRNKATEAINQQKADTAKFRAAAYDFHQRHPTMTIKSVPGGNMIGIDPVTGTSMNILDPATGQPIPSGVVTQEEHQNWDRETREAVARIQGANAAATKATPSGGTPTIEPQYDEQGNQLPPVIVKPSGQTVPVQGAKPIRPSTASKQQNYGTTTVTTQQGNTSTRVVTPNKPPAKSEKTIHVIGPNGESGTVPEGTKLPPGWKVG